MSRLLWGMIGGGEGSQIGPVHRIGAGIDGGFEFAAGALDVDPAKGRAFARELGVPADRAYGDWREMLDKERERRDRVDLVTVATPNATHYQITKAYLEAGFNVLCEKPMTTQVNEAEDIVATARRTGTICAVNYGYTGYPLVRQMRAMVAGGELGSIRIVIAEFAHGAHADAEEVDNPRIRWRYDPEQAGSSAAVADAGIHALHMACFVTGQEVSSLSADFTSTVAGRRLEDDAAINMRMDGGATCRLWTSAVAVGRTHGLTLQVFGERGGLRWSQEHPNQLFWTPVSGRTQVIERGAGDLSPEAKRASRTTTGHAEGMPLAFANIYRDLAEVIGATKEGRAANPVACHYPGAVDGFNSLAVIEAAVASAGDGGSWHNVRRLAI